MIDALVPALAHALAPLIAESLQSRLTEGSVSGPSGLPAEPVPIWMDLTTAARHASTSRERLREALACGECVGYQSMKGGRWRIHRDDLDR